ncbi:MAG TPA: hypothetical protein VIH05_11255 [Tepidiformaceae bacterium]
MNYDLNAHAEEIQARVVRANRTATLMASLGPLPEGERFRLFRRRSVSPLREPVEIGAYRGSRPAA